MNYSTATLDIQSNEFKPLLKNKWKSKSECQDFEEFFKKSFRAYGQIEPIILTKEEGSYLILQGESRLEALKNQGVETVQAVLYEGIEKDEARRMRIESKIVRKKMNIFEKAELFRKRKEQFKTDTDERNYFADNPEDIDISDFSDDIEKISNYSKRYIQMLIKIDKCTFDSVKKLILDNDSDLKYKITPLIELSRIENEEKQKAEAEKLLRDEPKKTEEEFKTNSETTNNTDIVITSNEVQNPEGDGGGKGKDNKKPSNRGLKYQIMLSEHKIYSSKRCKWLEMTEEYKYKFDDLYKEALINGVKPDKTETEGQGNNEVIEEN